MSEDFHVKVGDQVQFAKTVGESDVYLFAGITGDLSSNHVNEEVMRRSSYGRRIAHGALLIGFMSTTSTLMIEKSGGVGSEETPVSLGYDRIRFLAPVFIGDTITVTYRIAEIDPARRRSRSEIAGHQPGRHAGRGRPAPHEVGRQPRRPSRPGRRPRTGGLTERSTPPLAARQRRGDAADRPRSLALPAGAWRRHPELRCVRLASR